MRAYRILAQNDYLSGLIGRIKTKKKTIKIKKSLQLLSFNIKMEQFSMVQCSIYKKPRASSTVIIDFFIPLNI